MNKTLLIAGLAGAVIAGGIGQGIAKDYKGKMGQGQRPSFEELDANSDGKITAEEMTAHMQSRFDGADTDGDGAMSRDELIARMTARHAERIAGYADHMIERYDANDDGKLDVTEMQRRGKGGMIKRMDTDGDGAISKEEFDAKRAMQGKRHGKKNGNKNTD
jgi:Ca2+-binding EF-hand superfamily protein